MALPTVVTDFLTTVKNSLKQGSDLGSSVRGAAQNYLLAQDMATVLELLQDAMDQTTNLTATGGSTTTVVDGAGTFVPNQQAGNYITFDAATTTAALQGQTYRIASNDATTLTMEETMAAAAVSGDEFTITGGWFDDHIENLRDGNGLADAPRGSVYGDVRQVLDALMIGLRRHGDKATQTLTLTGQPIDTETVDVAGKTYTFQASLTDVDGNVAIGSDAAESLSNLVAAVTLGTGSGTAYAASMTANGSATIALDPTDSASLTAIATALEAGTAGNSLTSTETLTNGSWGAATFSGGTDGGAGTVAERTVSTSGLQTATGSTTTVVAVNFPGDVRIDQFRGYKITVGANEPRIVVSNDEDGNITVNRAFASAPSGSTAVTISVPEGTAGSVTAPKMRVHPAAQPGENAMVADLIEQLEDLMDTYVLPT